jgi:MoxR-like ATPase
VLLIDELDRADEPFEAFLLEVLADFQITIPELGTVKASTPPIVMITSNRTREIHDAVKRRCLYHWVDFPDARASCAILRVRAPGAVARRWRRRWSPSCRSCAACELFKLPGVAETIDWARALMALDAIGSTRRGGSRHAGRAAEVPGRHQAFALFWRDPDLTGRMRGCCCPR